MKERKSQSHTKRIWLLGAGIFVLYTLVIARSFQLQIHQGEELGNRAERQLTRKIALSPIRGEIMDINGSELAVNHEVSSIYAQPPSISDPAKVAAELADLLDENGHTLAKRLSSKKPFLWVKKGLPTEKGQKIAALKIKGVGVISENRRYYPNMELAGQLLGFSGDDSKGLEGVELKYNDLIKGTPGFFLAERDALGRSIYPRGLNIKDSTSGGTVALTIDKNIQYIAERELGEAIRKHSAKSGTAVVMSPQTGEILAMAVQPAFNPNYFRYSSPERWRNRAVTDTFEPGSTFKIFLAAAAIDSGKVGPKDIFFCENGKMKVYDKTIHDSKPYGWMTVENIMKVSSNIGSVKIAEKTGKAELYNYLEGFGFGRRTGIDFPGEAEGYLRAKNKLSPVGFANLSFGQGVSVTAVQMVNAISAVANGGYMMKPYIVKKITDEKGQTVFTNFPTRTKRIISSESALAVTEMLKQVTSEEGTGGRAALDGYQVAGKTGTSQKYDQSTGSYANDRHVSSFIGFLPADNPKLSILVMIDEPKDIYYGGQVAAPVFRKIAEQSLAQLQVAPEKRAPLVMAKNNPGITTNGNLVTSRRILKTDGKTVPDLRGLTLREAMITMGKAPSRIVGNGIITEQKPMPGEAFGNSGDYSVRLEETYSL